MARKVAYHSMFECDVREAASWYQQRSSSLAEDFVAKVLAKTEEIISVPQRFGKLTTGSKYAQVSRFPYLI